MNLESKQAQNLQELITFCKQYLSTQKRNDKSTYKDHADGVIEILKKNAYYKHSDSQWIAVYLHDLVVKKDKLGTEYPNPEFYKWYTAQISTLPKKEQVTALHALGIVTSKIYLESQIERWRELFVLEEHSKKKFLQSRPDYDFYRFLIEQILKKEYGNKKFDFAEVKNVMKDISNGLINGKSKVTKEMRLFRIPLDLINVIDILESVDLDSVRIHTAEVINNLQNPNSKKPAGAWRDAQELLILSTMLQIINDHKLAQASRSQALMYLNSDSKMFKEAILLHDYAEKFIEKYGEKLKKIMVEAVNETANEFKIQLNNKPIYSQRAKKIGSILEKFIKKPEYISLKTLPDIGGSKLIIDSLPKKVNKPLFMFYTAIALVLKIRASKKLPLETGNPKPEDHTVEINYGTSKDIISAIKYIKNNYKFKSLQTEGKNNFTIEIKPVNDDITFHIVFKPARDAKFGGGLEKGYQSVHISTRWKEKSKTLGYEFQVLDKSSEMNNRVGYAAHIFYKADESMGKLGNAIRKAQEKGIDPCDDYLVRSIVDENIKSLKRIDRRSLELEKERQWLHKNSIDLLLEIAEPLLHSQWGKISPKNNLKKLVLTNLSELYPKKYQEIMKPK